MRRAQALSFELCIERRRDPGAQILNERASSKSQISSLMISDTIPSQTLRSALHIDKEKIKKVKKEKEKQKGIPVLVAAIAALQECRFFQVSSEVSRVAVF